MKTMIKKELLEILACPVCKEGVEVKEEKIVCAKCNLFYPIKDGIPVMLAESAKPFKV